VVLLIGTNNVIWNEADDIARGVRAIVLELERRLPQTRVLLLALLPRGSWTPGDPLRTRIERVNARLEAFAQSRGLVYADLGDALQGPDGAIVPALLPDRLHPSAQGYARLAEGLAPYLDRILGVSAQGGDAAGVLDASGACAGDDPR
jgi:beta-glucosidase